MKEEQITEEVKRYLKDENYRCAIMIDGEWGCGKTHYIMEVLNDEVRASEKERKLKYISLFGCNSLNEVEEKVYWSIVNGNIDRVKKDYEEFENGKKTKDNNIVGRIVKTCAAKLTGAATKKLTFSIAKRFGLDISTNIVEYLEDVVRLGNYIFVFDDIERCSYPIENLFGYFSELVEHEDAKVILITNEREISKEAGNISTENNRRMQAELAAPDKNYWAVKEKVVGITIRYTPNYAVVIDDIIGGMTGSEDLKEVLRKNSDYFVVKMQELNCENFRTFRFFLSKVEYLYNRISELELMMERNEKQFLVDFMIQNCFLACLEHKASIKEIKEKIHKCMVNDSKVLKSVGLYVEKCEFDKARFESEIGQYIQEVSFGKSSIRDSVRNVSYFI